MSIKKNFVVKHGLEVATDVLLVSEENRNIGIGSTIPQRTLDVRGSIGSTDLYVSGFGTIVNFSANSVSISTITGVADFNSENGTITNFESSVGIITNFSSSIGTITNFTSTIGIITNFYSSIGTITAFESSIGIITNLSGTNFNSTGISTFNNVDINGLLTAGSSEGVTGQYLRHTGTGVTWSSIQSSVVQTDTQTASEGQTVFNTDYTVGLVEVYLNGVRLSGSEFVANDGSTITLLDAAFGDDTLDFVSYNPFSEYPTFFWQSGEGQEIYYDHNVGIGTTNPTQKLQVGGAVLASDGFISVGNTTPIQISLVGNQLTFIAAGIGSTTFTLS